MQFFLATKLHYYIRACVIIYTCVYIISGQSKHKERRKVKQFNTFNLKGKMGKK